VQVKHLPHKNVLLDVAELQLFYSASLLLVLDTVLVHSTIDWYDKYVQCLNGQNMLH